MNRQQRRMKHKLIEFHGQLKMNINFGDSRKWTCTCGSGWLSIGPKRPTEAHEAHVKQSIGVELKEEE